VILTPNVRKMPARATHSFGSFRYTYFAVSAPRTAFGNSPRFIPMTFLPVLRRRREQFFVDTCASRHGSCQPIGWSASPRPVLTASLRSVFSTRTRRRNAVTECSFLGMGGLEIQKGRNFQSPHSQKSNFGMGKRSEFAVGVGRSRRETEKTNV
jgi:hypothetical protein